jgi:hypothetical protein
MAEPGGAAMHAMLVSAGAMGRRSAAASKYYISERILAADVSDCRVHPGEQRIVTVCTGRRRPNGDNRVRSKCAVTIHGTTLFSDTAPR